MREIKFRKWDAENKVMIGADALAFEEYEPLADLLANCENLMQFTGLLDFCKAEIYESDIVQGDVSQVIGDDITVRGIVTWGDDGLWMVDLPHLGQSIGIQALTDIVRLGDSYSNPELLESNPPDSLTKK